MKLFDVPSRGPVSSADVRANARASLEECSTEYVLGLAQACADVLRERGRSLGIEGDGAHHHDALRSIESLATSARTVANLRAARPANDNAKGEG